MWEVFFLKKKLKKKKKIFSRGAIPFGGLSNSKVIEKVKQGLRLNPPSNCPILISKMMQECWKNEVSERPSFSNLIEKFEEIPMKEFGQDTEIGLAIKPLIENQSHYEFDPLSSSKFFKQSAK